MNGFGGTGTDNEVMKLVSLMLQSLFPPIKVHEMNLSTCRRVVMFNRTGEGSADPNEGEIEFRHYAVSAR